jgi:hypothetical protein
MWGHSTPTLTARYMHVRLRDAAGAVDKMPHLVPTAGPNANRAEIPLRMTGTDGAKPDNRGRGAVVPGVVTGGANGHQSASSCNLRVVGVNPVDVPQPLESGRRRDCPAVLPHHRTYLRIRRFLTCL